MPSFHVSCSTSSTTLLSFCPLLFVAAFEKSTTKFKGKKYLNTCRVEPTPICKDQVTLGNWLLGEYGQYKVAAKMATYATTR
jgi:hypothetical protein